MYLTELNTISTRIPELGDRKNVKNLLIQCFYPAHEKSQAQTGEEYLAGSSTEIKIWNGFCLVTFQHNLLSVSLHILVLKASFSFLSLNLKPIRSGPGTLWKAVKMHGAHRV